MFRHGAGYKLLRAGQGCLPLGGCTALWPPTDAGSCRRQDWWRRQPWCAASGGAAGVDRITEPACLFGGCWRSPGSLRETSGSWPTVGMREGARCGPQLRLSHRRGLHASANAAPQARATPLKSCPAPAAGSPHRAAMNYGARKGIPAPFPGVQKPLVRQSCFAPCGGMLTSA